MSYKQDVIGISILAGSKFWTKYKRTFWTKYKRTDI